MSKSYDNTIPLFVPKSELKKLIAGIVTDSRLPGEAKDTEGSALMDIFRAFANAEESAAMAEAFKQGIGWGDAKTKLVEQIDREVAPMRERYEALMAKPQDIEALLRDGAARRYRLIEHLHIGHRIGQLHCLCRPGGRMFIPDADLCLAICACEG